MRISDWSSDVCSSDLHWVQAFERAGVPAGPVKNIKQALDDPQTRVRDMVIKVAHPVAGEIDALGLPIKFSHGNGITRRGAPLYGQHTKEVMAEIGYRSEEQKSEIQPLMPLSYAVFCLKKKNTIITTKE